MILVWTDHHCLRVGHHIGNPWALADGVLCSFGHGVYSGGGATPLDQPDPTPGG
jgi:hypothetical protein